MPSVPELYELIYVSTISPDVPPGVVANIANDARIANERLEISGLLVFDGLRFAQHLEGARKTVLELFARIKADSRHIAVNLRHQGACTHRNYPVFSMGFSDSPHDALGALEDLSGTAALDAFADIYEKVELYA